MAIITLDDGSVKLEFPIFNEVYAAYSENLSEDALVIFKVRVIGVKQTVLAGVIDYWLIKCIAFQKLERTLHPD